MTSVSAATAFHWLLLQRLPGFHAGAQRKLLAKSPLSSPEQWLSWPAPRLRGFGLGDDALEAVAEWRRRGMDCAAAAAARRDQDWLDAHGAHIIPLNDGRYPALLQETADPPPCLYVRGDPTQLTRPQLAIVGSRRATRQGLADAHDFAQALAQAGFVITSGLALGIDAAAHRAALGAGGATVAVLGCGLDTVYPARHRELAEQIGSNGAVVSELPLGSPPLAQHFPSRNRIISGLSLGVLVVEAMLQSGSLITARLALEQNREVFAIPGSIRNPVSRGCNALIRRGAVLVQEVADILEELHGWTQPQPRAAIAPAAALSSAQAEVLAAVEFRPTALDLIAVAVAQPLPAVLAALSELELYGLVENIGGSYQRTGLTSQCAPG
jgi:DNA processing protein